MLTSEMSMRLKLWRRREEKKRKDKENVSLDYKTK